MSLFFSPGFIQIYNQTIPIVSVNSRQQTSAWECKSSLSSTDLQTYVHPIICCLLAFTIQAIFCLYSQVKSEYNTSFAATKAVQILLNYSLLTKRYGFVLAMYFKMHLKHEERFFTKEFSCMKELPSELCNHTIREIQSPHHPFSSEAIYSLLT